MGFRIPHFQHFPPFASIITGCYILLTIVTFGIYQLVASICNLTFDASKPKNIGYKKDAAQA